MQMEALEAVHRESRRLPPIQKVSSATHPPTGADTWTVKHDVVWQGSAFLF